MLPDFQMVRGPTDSYNYSVGEPYFLQKYLRIPDKFGKLPFNYPSIGGDKKLLEELQQHFPDSYVIITNGAKQGIAASLYARKIVFGEKYAFCKAPYWPSFRSLIEMANLEFIDKVDTGKWGHTITINTTPNNPDGECSNGLAEIHDAAYASSVYGFDYERDKPPAQIQVFSAAKLLGLSGCRVGWVVTKNKKIANEVANFVELTTTGVSIPSQNCVANALNMVYNEDCSNAFSSARKELLMNGEMFNEYLGKYCDMVQGVPTNQKGMFSFFKIDLGVLQKFRQVIQDNKIMLVTGDACGIKEPGWFRMSMGNEERVTREGMQLIRLNMEGV